MVAMLTVMHVHHNELPPARTSVSRMLIYVQFNDLSRKVNTKNSDENVPFGMICVE